MQESYGGMAIRFLIVQANVRRFVVEEGLVPDFVRLSRTRHGALQNHRRTAALALLQFTKDPRHFGLLVEGRLLRVDADAVTGGKVRRGAVEVDNGTRRRGKEGREPSMNNRRTTNPVGVRGAARPIGQSCPMRTLRHGSRLASGQVGANQTRGKPTRHPDGISSARGRPRPPLARVPHAPSLSIGDEWRSIVEWMHV